MLKSYSDYLRAQLYYSLQHNKLIDKRGSTISTSEKETSLKGEINLRSEIKMSTDTKENDATSLCVVCRENPCNCLKELL
jgi:hypothetical protein